MKSLDVCERLHTCKHVNKINQVGNIAESHKSSSRNFLKPTPWGQRSGGIQNNAKSIHPSRWPATDHRTSEATDLSSM